MRSNGLRVMLVVLVLAIAIAPAFAQATPVFANIAAAQTAITDVAADYPDFNMLGLAAAVVVTGVLVLLKIFKGARR